MSAAVQAGRCCCCADIGSTWTKSALFQVVEGRAELLARHDLPTTVEDLSRGFLACRDEVLRRAGCGAAPATVVASSSAKGGLGIAALGLVPELTLKAAREAAASAGGKILGAFAGVVSPSDLAAIRALRPDILLFCGGTDHGNRDQVLENARRLAALDPAIAILFAGNRSCRDEVRELLPGHEVCFADNVMPEVNRLEVEDARRAIRELFLRQIVDGKGLGPVMAATGGQLLPTPLAVHGFVELLSERQALGGPFLLLDPGGATTDVYSACAPFAGEAGTVFRGLEEPFVKRTVEGDLGFRHSAMAALAAAGEDDPGLLAAAARLAASPGSLPATDAERAAERRLAAACLAEGIRRHAGRLRTVWTPQGAVSVQTGKDLRAVRTVVGSGGFLSRCDEPGLLAEALRGLSAASDPEHRLLTPEASSAYCRDADYLLPLAALLARVAPAAAADWFVGALMR